MTKDKNEKNTKQAGAGTTMSLQSMIDAIKRASKPIADEFEPDAEFVTNCLRAEFVAQVRAVMRAKGIKSGAGLAKITGISRERISRILQENGNLELRTIAKIAVALDAPVALRIGKENVAQLTTPKQQHTRHYFVANVNRQVARTMPDTYDPMNFRNEPQVYTRHVELSKRGLTSDSGTILTFDRNAA